MSSTPSYEYRVVMAFTTRDSLHTTGRFLEQEYMRVVDRRQDKTGQQLTENTEPDALFALLLLYASFAKSLIEVTTVGPHEPDAIIHIRPEGHHGFFFYRPDAKTFGSMNLHDGAWSVTYEQ